MTRKRWIVGLLATGLAALGIYGWTTGTATSEVLRLIAIGLVLAILYLVRGGTLPAAASYFVNVAPDEAPGNLPPRIYLPILLAAILMATILILWTVNR
jgi:hypothetical protein